jgi:hypothetical protein
VSGLTLSQGIRLCQRPTASQLACSIQRRPDLEFIRKFWSRIREATDGHARRHSRPQPDGIAETFQGGRDELNRQQFALTISTEDIIESLELNQRFPDRTLSDPIHSQRSLAEERDASFEILPSSQAIITIRCLLARAELDQLPHAPRNLPNRYESWKLRIHVTMR